jgi:hypothetical protein
MEGSSKKKIMEHFVPPTHPQCSIGWEIPDRIIRIKVVSDHGTIADVPAMVSGKPF